MGSGASSTTAVGVELRSALDKPCDASDLKDKDAEAAWDEVRILRRQLAGMMRAGQLLGLAVEGGQTGSGETDESDEIDQIADAITAAVRSTYHPSHMEEHDPLRRTLESLLPQLCPAPASPRLPQSSPSPPSEPGQNRETSADDEMTTAAGRRQRLARALPLKLGVECGAWAKELANVVTVMASGDLAAANDDTTNHGVAFADQVSIGGDVFFIILSPRAEPRDEDGRERVVVVKFGRTTMETQSESRLLITVIHERQ